jgi:hypothetical protein
VNNIVDKKIKMGVVYVHIPSYISTVIRDTIKNNGYEDEVK